MPQSHRKSRGLLVVESGYGGPARLGCYTPVFPKENR